jgi:hypothetical protein
LILSSVKKAREEKSLCSFSKGKATDELDDILTIAAKTEITNHFREF